MGLAELLALADLHGDGWDGRRVLGVENGVVTVYVSEAFEVVLASTACVPAAMPASPMPTITGDTTYTTTAVPLSQSCVTWKSYYSGVGGSVERVEYGDTAKTDQVFTLLQDHLGGTNQVVDSSGAATQMRYGVWGEARDAVSNLPTSRLYTGQEKSNTGLYYYNARWYDSELSRFVQPDSLIPQPYNPLTLDRFSYVQNNPVNYTDPTGHDAECGMGDSYKCFDIRRWNRNHPKVDDISNLERRPTAIIKKTIAQYSDVREYLYLKHGHKAVDENGMINDQYLIAGLIYGEFGTKTGTGYDEALEAVSNQYHDGNDPLYPNQMLCEGNCTLEKQIAWMSDAEAFYNGKLKTDLAAVSVDLTAYLEDARKAMGNFYVGEDRSWMWGDVTDDELKNYSHIYFKGPSNYPGKDWWIVH